MSHWVPGKVILPKENIDSRIARYFKDYEIAWVIARHNTYIYFKIQWPGREIIMRCAKTNMPKYFTEQMFHEEMPFVNGPFKEIPVFPDAFLGDMPGPRP